MAARGATRMPRGSKRSNPSANKSSHKAQYNVLPRLCCREIRGSLQQHRRSRTMRIFSKIPGRLGFSLKSIVDESDLENGHVFLGFSRCGQYVLSYTVQLEADEHTAYPVHVYRLQWWHFVPLKPLEKISEFRLFGEEDIQQYLYVAVCEWPEDGSKILVYGQGTSEDKVDQNLIQCYVTICAVPSLQPCKTCAEVAAARAEEAQNNFVSADPQLPAKCLKHTFTVHTKYELAPPYPAFNPRSFLKLDGVAILNTGYSLVALNVELEGEDNKYTADLYTPDFWGNFGSTYSTPLVQVCSPRGVGSVYFEKPCGSPGYREPVPILQLASPKSPYASSRLSANTDRLASLENLVPKPLGESSDMGDLLEGEVMSDSAHHCDTRRNQDTETNLMEGTSPRAKPLAEGTTSDSEEKWPSRGSVKDRNVSGNSSTDRSTKQGDANSPALHQTNRNNTTPPKTRMDIYNFSHPDHYIEVAHNTPLRNNSLSNEGRGMLSNLTFHCKNRGKDQQVPHSSSDSDSKEIFPPETERSKDEAKENIPCNDLQICTDNTRYLHSDGEVMEPLSMTVGRNYPGFPFSPAFSKQSSNSSACSSCVSSPVVLQNDSQCFTYSARRYVENNSDPNLPVDAEDDLSLAYQSVLPVEVHGSNYSFMRLVTEGTTDKESDGIIVKQLTLDVEQYIGETVKNAADWGHRYIAFTDYDVQILEVCPESFSVIVMLLVLVRARPPSKDKADSKHYNRVTPRVYQTGFKFVWNLQTGSYDTVDIDDLVEFDQSELMRKEWRPGQRACLNMQRQWHVPQTRVNEVNVLTNEAVFRGQSLKMLIDPLHYVAIVL